MKPGIYEGISHKDYFALPLASPSEQKHGLKSPLHMKRYLDGEIQYDSNAITVGSAVHAIIEGEFEERYATMEAFEKYEDNVTVKGVRTTSKNTIYYKEQAELWALENADKEHLSEAQVAVASKAANAIRAHAGDMIDRSAKEVTVIGEIEIPYKTRLDGLRYTGDHTAIVWDIKTTTDIGDGFYRTFKRLNYGFSCSVHVELLRQLGVVVTHYYYIACEVENDFDCRLIEVPRCVWENGIDEVRRVARQYKTALAMDTWPGIEDGDLAIPNWDMQTLERDEP